MGRALVLEVPFLRARIPEPDEWLPFLRMSYEAGQFSNFGPCYRALQKALEEEHTMPGYRVALVCNATAGLTVALMSQGVTGKVLVPSFTFPATLHSILGAGCQPVLIDVDPVTWEVSPETLSAAIKEHPDAQALVPVRVFGFWRDHSTLLQAADAHGLTVITDAAAAFGCGADFTSRPIGSTLGHTEVFSFHVTKVFGLGEGGGVFLPEDKLPALERAMNFGFQPNRDFVDGANAKMDEVHSAIGLARLKTLEDDIHNRTRIARNYYDEFLNVAGVRLADDPETCSPWQTFPVEMPSKVARDHVLAACQAQGITLRPYYSPSLSAGYLPLGAGRVIARPTPVANQLADTMLCLPIYPSLSDDEAQAVVRVVKTALETL